MDHVGSQVGKCALPQYQWFSPLGLSMHSLVDLSRVFIECVGHISVQPRILCYLDSNTPISCPDPRPPGQHPHSAEVRSLYGFRHIGVPRYQRVLRRPSPRGPDRCPCSRLRPFTATRSAHPHIIHRIEKFNHQIEATCPLFLTGLITHVYLVSWCRKVDYSANLVQWATSTCFISMG